MAAASRNEWGGQASRSTSVSTCVEALPPDAFEVIVDALANALVADFQQDTRESADISVASPQGIGRGSTGKDDPVRAAGSDDETTVFATCSTAIR